MLHPFSVYTELLLTAYTGLCIYVFIISFFQFQVNNKTVFKNNFRGRCSEKLKLCDKLDKVYCFELQ